MNEPELLGKINTFSENWNLEKALRIGQDLNFEEVKNIVESESKYLLLIKEYPEFLYEIPEQQKAGVLSVIDSLLTELQRLQDFKIVTEADYRSEHINITSSVKDRYPAFYKEIVQPLKAHIALDRTNKEGLKSVNKLAKQFERQQNDIERIKQAEEVAAGNASADASNTFFADEAANIHEPAARIWLIAAGVCLLLALIISGFVFIKLYHDPNILKQNPAAFSIKTFVAIVGFYVARVCFRQYSVHKHLETLNRHRANIMRTLPGFAESVGDNRDIVYGAGAKAVFDAGETGFITRKEGAGADDSFVSDITNEILRRK